MLRKNFLWIAIIMVCLVLPPPFVLAQGTQRSINEDLMYRISFGRVDDVKGLLEKGAETNTYGNMGDTPLTLAMSRNPGEADDMVKALLAKGADPNFPDKNGLYPLEVAIKHNRPSIVTILIAGGADIHLKTGNGMTMIDLANQGNKPEITKLINDRLQNEINQEAQLRDPTRLLALIHQFSTSVCEMTYWNNYLMSEQKPEDNSATRDKIDTQKNLGEKVGREIATYFPKVELKSYITFSADSITNVFKALPTLQVRIENGIGSEDDAHKRCAPIADAARTSISKILDAQKAADEKAKHQAELMGTR